jgi:hypothetical protein
MQPSCRWQRQQLAAFELTEAVLLVPTSEGLRADQPTDRTMQCVTTAFSLSSMMSVRPAGKRLHIGHGHTGGQQPGNSSAWRKPATKQTSAGHTWRQRRATCVCGGHEVARQPVQIGLHLGALVPASAEGGPVHSQMGHVGGASYSSTSLSFLSCCKPKPVYVGCAVAAAAAAEVPAAAALLLPPAADTCSSPGCSALWDLARCCASNVLSSARFRLLLPVSRFRWSLLLGALPE